MEFILFSIHISTYKAKKRILFTNVIRILSLSLSFLLNTLSYFKLFKLPYSCLFFYSYYCISILYTFEYICALTFAFHFY